MAWRMNDRAELVVDGITVRFLPADGGRERVLVEGSDIGSIETVEDGSGYVARGSDGEPVTRASQWGGRVTARFGTIELAVRALLERSR